MNFPESVGQIPAVVRSVPRYLRERADELRAEVDTQRTVALHYGCSPEQIARIGALELGWADFLDALGGRRP